VEPVAWQATAEVAADAPKARPQALPWRPFAGDRPPRLIPTSPEARLPDADETDPAPEQVTREALPPAPNAAPQALRSTPLAGDAAIEEAPNVAESGPEAAAFEPSAPHPMTGTDAPVATPTPQVEAETL
jgi:hypothetical protein